MPIVLPNQFLPAMRLLGALQGNGSERDEHLIRLALGHLEPGHREHIRSRVVGQNELWAFEMAHRHDRIYQALTRNTLDALRVVFWKLGFITYPGTGHKRRALQCPLVIGLMEKHLGVDPTRTEFACLACGNPVYLKVGQKGRFTCPTCGHDSRLSYNDGRRIAFSRPKRVPEIIDSGDIPGNCGRSTQDRPRLASWANAFRRRFRLYHGISMTRWVARWLRNKSNR